MLTAINAQGPTEVFPGVVLSPNGGIVFFVSNAGAAALDLLPVGLQYPTPGSFEVSIAAAAAKCRANRGDRIICLPSHTETVATASAWSALPAGVTITSVGDPETDQRAKINFTAAVATLVLPAGTVLDNFIIDCCATAAVVVAAPFSIAASGIKIQRNRIHVATSATQLATAPFTVAAGGDFHCFDDNEVWTTGAGTFATNPTNVTLVSGAVQGFKYRRNYVYGGTAAATGQLQFSAAATNVRIENNVMINQFATATSNVVGFAGVTGTVSGNQWSVGNNGVASAQGLTVPGSLRAFQNFCSDEDGKSGVLSPVVVTT
jgi:hypothetical protein